MERRLGISKNSALLLKRRLQLFASDQMEKIKTLMQAELTEKFPETKLPPTAGDQHVSTVIGDRAVPQADSCVLYSASQRANQGRKRHKHTGQTASIYLSDKLGGAQRGTLVHTLSWKNGPVIYDSIPNNQAQTLRPLLDKYIPKNVPLFTDEGYKFYFRINQNHRMVNHNRKSSDPRYKWAKNRWSINGIHNQVAEGNHRNLKYHFTAGYSYIRPEFSQLYLNEYAFWKSLKYYGWSKLIDPRLKSHLPKDLEAQSPSTRATGSSTKPGTKSSPLSTLTTDFPIQLQYPKPMKKYVRRTSTASRKQKPSSTELSANNQTGNIPKKVELFQFGCINPVSGVRPDKNAIKDRSVSPNPAFRTNFSETAGVSDCAVDASEAPPSLSLGKVRRKFCETDGSESTKSAYKGYSLCQPILPRELCVSGIATPVPQVLPDPQSAPDKVHFHQGILYSLFTPRLSAPAITLQPHPPAPFQTPHLDVWLGPARIHCAISPSFVRF
ncbi:transposase [Turneriella parva]|nr:transposase [Turneriella parva]